MKFIGTNKTVNWYNLSTEWGSISLIGSLNPFPVVLTMSKVYYIYILYTCTSFCRDVHVQGSQKAKPALNAS